MYTCNRTLLQKIRPSNFGSLLIDVAATHCNTLHHTAVCCTTLQHTVAHYNTLQDT